MKLQTNTQKLAREVSLKTLASAYLTMAEHFENLAKNTKVANNLEILWFMKDAQGKILKTGSCHKMAFRRNQTWRNFKSVQNYAKTEDVKVYMMDITSGIQVHRTLKYAFGKTAKELKKELTNEIIGLK